MVAVSFEVPQSLLPFLAHTLKSVLCTCSSQETEDRWNNADECLRIAATVRDSQPDRALLSKVAVILTAAWETAEGSGIQHRLPQHRGKVTLSCHAPDDPSRLHDLAHCAETHMNTSDQAIADLSQLLRHCRKAQSAEKCIGPFSTDLSEACQLLEAVNEAFEALLLPAWQN